MKRVEALAITYINRWQLERVADVASVRATMSPRVQPVLQQIAKLHDVARHPAIMAQLTDEFNSRATKEDMQKAANA